MQSHMNIQFLQLVCTSHWTQKELSIFKYNMHMDIPMDTICHAVVDLGVWHLAPVEGF